MARYGRVVRGRSDELILAILLLIGAIFSAAPRTSSTQVIHNLMASGNALVDSMFGWVFDISATKRKNAELHRQVAELSLDRTGMEEVRLQNERFRALLQWEEEHRPVILRGAEVIAHGDGRQSFAVTISVGTRHGVERNQAVVTADGLVGRIDREPGSSTSIVSLLNDPANAVAAVVQRSRVQGVFQFIEGEGRLLHVLQAAVVDSGDVIISSGLGGIYPEGLMIGTVESVDDDPDGVTLKVVVATAAALDRLEEVFILHSGGGGMNRFLRYLFFGLAAVVFQTYLVPALGIFGQRPDLIVIFALTVGVLEGAGRGSLAGFLAGLAVDMYHPPTFGAGAMAGTVVGYFGGRARIFLDLDHVVNQMMAYAGGHAAHAALFAIVTSLQGVGPVARIFFSNGIGGAIYTALLGSAIMTAVSLVRGSRHIVDRR